MTLTPEKCKDCLETQIKIDDGICRITEIIVKICNGDRQWNIVDHWEISPCCDFIDLLWYDYGRYHPPHVIFHKVPISWLFLPAAALEVEVSNSLRFAQELSDKQEKEKLEKKKAEDRENRLSLYNELRSEFEKDENRGLGHYGSF